MAGGHGGDGGDGPSRLRRHVPGIDAGTWGKHDGPFERALVSARVNPQPRAVVPV